MNENLDLTKILEGCPQGTKFYSSIYGEVSFVEIKICFAYPIMLMSYGINQLPAGQICYAKDGNYNSAYNGECTLFPSKDQRDWSKFVRFWDKLKVEKFDPKTLQPFDKVLIRNVDNGFWNAAFFSYIAGQWVNCVGSGTAECIPYNEETKHLLGTKEDCPEFYKWWEE